MAPVFGHKASHIPHYECLLLTSHSHSIRPISDPVLRDTWPEALYLAYKHCTLNYTIETASTQPLEQRITTQCAVLKAAVHQFLA